MDITNEIDNALYEKKQLSKLVTVLVRPSPVNFNFFFSTLSLSSLNRKAKLGRNFSCLGLQQSVAKVDVSHFVSMLMCVNNIYHLFGKIWIFF